MTSLLFLIPTLCDRGAERVLVNLANNLDKTRFRVTVQTLFDVGENRALLHDDVEYIGGLPFIFRGNVTLMKLMSPRFLYDRIIGDRRYDILIAYLEGPAARIISGCPFKEVKKLAWIHVQLRTKEYAKVGFHSYQEALQSYSRFDRIVCVSETVKQDFEQQFPLKAEVLYNVNEDAQIRELAEQGEDEIRCPSDSINLVSVGKLDKQKGYDRLIKVHDRLLKAGYHIHIYIIGSGNERHNLEKEIVSRNLQDSFHLLGYQSNPYKFMAKADLYVCSSFYEGLSTSVTEALILGLPVVSTLCSGAKELLGDNNEFGLVVPNSEDGLFEGIKKMISSPDLMTYYRTQARQRSSRFSKAVTLRKHEAFFESLITETI